MTHPSRISLTESIIAILVIGLALWTLLTHAIGFLFNGNFITLSLWSWLVPAAIYPVYRFIYAPVTHQEPILTEKKIPLDWHQFAIAVALVALYEFSDYLFPAKRLYLFWILALFFLGRAWLATRTEENPAPGLPVKNRTETMLFGLLIASIVLVTLVAHRPDQDDQYYSNIPVTTLEYPDTPLLSQNGMIWSEGKTTWLPVDRLPSYELLVALVASFTNAEPIAISHLFFAPLFAAWTLLIQALVLRHLVPRYWLAALLVTVFLLLAIGGETRAGYSVFAFVQLHFGKSLLFSAMAPLLVLFGLRFMQTGQRRDWLLLFISQIAALGCSSSGLFVAPVAAGLGLAATWKGDWASTKRLLLGVVASGYPLGIGLIIIGTTTAIITDISWTPLPLENNFSKVFGAGTNLWLYLLTLIGAWTLMTDPWLRRFLLGISFIFTAFFLNPFLYPIFSQYLTGPMTTWRLNFAIPLPIMASLLVLALHRSLNPPPLFLAVLTVLLLTFFPQWRGFWSQPFSLVACIVILLMFTQQTTGFRPTIALLTLMVTLTSLTHLNLSTRAKYTTLAAPRTQIHFPQIKAPPLEFSVAQQVIKLAPTGKSALVPEKINVWVPTLRHNPRLVATSGNYLEQLKVGLEPQALERRLMLFDYISGSKRPADAPWQLTNALSFYKIGILVSHQENPWLAEIDTILQAAGFQKSSQNGYLFWVNPF
ncbi:MAG: hypothetical protein HQL94_03440 [Magnetococcales bacterium]|nr:hypothetical protein [Magnetococcales bacterium]